MLTLKADGSAVQYEVEKAMMAAEARAQQAGQNIQSALSVTATPVVDTSSLSRALALAQAVGAAISSIGNATVASPAKPSGAVDGKRAGGGPVRAGLTYLVGERGPERLTMGSRGHITPNHKLGGAARSAPSISAVFNINGGADPMAIARQIQQQLDELVNRSAGLAIDGRDVI